MTAPADPGNAAQWPTVLLVDDEVRSLDAMRRTLDEEFRILTAENTEAARRLLVEHEVGVILCDQRMPGQSGVEFLKEVRETWPDCVRIVISGYTDSEDIIAGVNEAGLFQYVLKPWMPDVLLDVVRRAVQARDAQTGLHRLDLELRNSPRALRERQARKLGEVRQAFGFDRILRAPGSPLQSVCDMAARVALHDLSVLIQGESGTGKELLARAIHYASPRMSGPFVVENCAALADTLLESELFGHKRGAFTGAVDDHVGLIQRADRGTLFLDEIGETSRQFQVKLLRVLQEGELRPVGSTRPVPVDIRVVCATHRHLEDEVRAGRFREDLYYRLAEVTLELPPLRDRVGDVVLLAQALLEDVLRAFGRAPMQFSAETLTSLIAYPWPGNIRELRNEIARAVALSDGPLIEPLHLSRKVVHGQSGRSIERQLRARMQPHAAERGLAGQGSVDSGVDEPGTLVQRLDAMEAMILREAMQRHRWNKTQAAQELGLSRVGLLAKLRRLGLEKERR